MNEISALIEKAIEQKNCFYPVNDAFTELVQKYQDLIFGYNYAITRDYYLSQDITQEVFIIAYNKLENLCNYDSFPYWIKKIAGRECIRVLNRRKKQELSLENIENYQNKEATPQQTYEAAEARNEIRDVIIKLPEIQRIPTILYYINGYSQQEVAEFLNIGLDTVKKRLQRAREQLKREMMPMVKENLEKIRPSKDDKLVQKICLYTTFDTVAKNGQLDLLEQMLVDGIDLNESDAAGRTLLFWAVENNHLEAVKLLIKSGADKLTEDKNGKSALELAKQKKNKAVLEALSK